MPNPPCKIGRRRRHVLLKLNYFSASSRAKKTFFNSRVEAQTFQENLAHI